MEESPNYAPYAKNLALSALEAWEDANPNLQFMSLPNQESCLEMRGFTNSCFVTTWAKEPQGDWVGYAEYEQLPDGTRLPGWHMQVSLGKTIQGYWQPYSDGSVETIARHEIGHILGHDHSSDPDSIMFPTMAVAFETDIYDWASPPSPTPSQKLPSAVMPPKPPGELSGPQIILSTGFLETNKFQKGEPIIVSGQVTNAECDRHGNCKEYDLDQEEHKVQKPYIINNILN